MKIEWLNSEMTEVVVTKGWLWWRRSARLRRGYRCEVNADICSRNHAHWTFVVTLRQAECSLSAKIDGRRQDVLDAVKHDAEWTRDAAPIPKATARERG